MHFMLIVLGNYFAGGQSVNTMASIPAKLGERQRAKENEALRQLGVKSVDKILECQARQKKSLEVFNKNGTFKSHLNHVEREAVKTVAHGMRKHFQLK